MLQMETGYHRLRCLGALVVSVAVSSSGCLRLRVRTAALGCVVLPGARRWQVYVAPASVAAKDALIQGSGRLQLPLAFHRDGAKGSAYESQTMSSRRRR